MKPACLPSATSSRSARFPDLRRVVVAFLIVVLAAILAPIDFPTAPADSSEVSPLVTLAKIRDAWVQDLRTKKLEPILKFYAPDAAFLQPTGERITGSAALRSLFQAIMATFNSDLMLNSKNLETSGDLAYDSGDFQETLTNIASGAKVSSKGSYVIIYKRQLNGSWQIVQHVWTGIPPAGT